MSERVRDDETRRWRLQERLARYFDVPLTLLAFALLALLIIEFGVQPGEPWSSRIEAANLIIWAVFAVAFAVEFAIAPRKLAYLRRNWLSALSVALPAFRVLRTFRALRALRGVRALRSLTLARGVTALGRARRELASYLRQYQFGYLLAVTVLVTLLAAALVYFLERGANTSITSFGEALWWAAAIVTTVNAQQEAVTPEGRIVALALRVYGVAVIGYLTASIAVYLLGRPAAGPAVDRVEQLDSEAAHELRQLRQEISALRRDLKRSLRAEVH